jgi:hypothetical protein
MVRGHLSNYKGINTLNLVGKLKQQKLSETNRIRLQDIESTISGNYAIFAIPKNTEDLMLQRTENMLGTNEASTLTPPQHRMH